MGVETAVLAGYLGTTVLLAGGATAAAMSASSSAKANTAAKNAASDAAMGDKPAMPAAPMGAEATSAEKARIRKKSKTLLSAPLSGGEYYGSPAPTLLGTGDSTKKTTLG